MSVSMTIESMIATHPFWKGMDQTKLRTLASCARLTNFPAGTYLARRGGPANAFFLIQSGHVAIEFERQLSQILTVGRGEVVGWSWIVAPFSWQFDARAVVAVEAMALEAACLRSQCEADHEFGYQLLTRLLAVVTERIAAARLQLLDLYR